MSRDLIAETIQPPQQQHIPARVFINYAREDRELAVWLRDKLLEAGVATVWLDRAQIEGGDQWKESIDHGLRRATVLLALLTKNSDDPSREWIEYERNEAVRLFKPIIPLRFDAEVEPPEPLRHLHYIDFADGRDDDAILRLRSAIADATPRYTSRTPLPVEPPASGDAFVGRELELKELFALIATPAARVSTARQPIAIQGMGGQGKTMLAEELLRRLAPRYPGGVLIERRGQSREPSRAVLDRWVELARGEAPSREYTPAEVRSLLGSYGELLVLIDDVSESDFAVTRELLYALPADATRLITTRSLNVRSELGCVVYELFRLKDEDARALVLDRLRAMDGGDAEAEVLPEQEEAIRRLIDLVDGHALALELAAARCDFPESLPDVVDELAGSLAEGLEGMKVSLTRADRQDNCLTVSLNISLEQLSEYDRAQGTTWAARFAELGVCPDNGRMNRELIAAVWGDAGAKDPRTSDALSGLYRRAMIKREPKSKLYSAHPLLGAFARGLLRQEPERLAAARLRYRDFLTRAAAQGFAQPEEHWSSMEMYTPHLLHTAEELWEECTSLPLDLDALAKPEAPSGGFAPADAAAREVAAQALRFVDAVKGYVLRRPALGETGRRLLVLGLACVRVTGRADLEDTFVRALGSWYARHNPTEAEHYFEQALRWAEQTRDRAEEGKILSEYGELQRNRSLLDDAIRLLDRALAIHEDLGDQLMQAATHKSLGEAYWRRCDFDVAMEHYHRARDLYRMAENQSGEADLLNKIGSVEFNRGNYEKAISYFQEALPMHRKVGNGSMEGEDLNDMGISYSYLKQHDEALEHLGKAVELHREHGNRRLEAIARSNLAATYCALGRQRPGEYEKAAQEARNALAIARDIECRFTEVWALNWEAVAQQELGRPQTALRLLKRAVELLKETRVPRECVTVWSNLGYLLGKHLGEREQGVDWLRRAMELMRENRFERAFGGRSWGDLEALLREISV